MPMMRRRSNQLGPRRALAARLPAWLLAGWLVAAPIARSAPTTTAQRIPALAAKAGSTLDGAGREARPASTRVEIAGDGDLDRRPASPPAIPDASGRSPFEPIFQLPSTHAFGLGDVGAYAAPGFVDVDGDGDLDAFVGNSAGEIRFFENTGTSKSAAFASPSLQPFGLHVVTYGAVPRFVDIDGDGDLDAFVGSGYGDVVFFENTGSASSPAFLDAGFGALGITNVGNYACPALGDLDGDGDLDLLVGVEAGDTFLLANTGSAIAPAFAAGSIHPFGLSNVGSFAAPALVDLDGDGDLDALLGDGDGDALFFANTGTAASAAFASPVSEPFGLTNVGGFGVADFADIDGDGDLDAFVGNAAGQSVFFQNLTAHPLFDDDFESGGTWHWTVTVP